MVGLPSFPPERDPLEFAPKRHKRDLDIASMTAASTANVGATVGRLDQIGNLLRTLTYGEMVTLASELWAVKGEMDICAAALPMVFHKWSKSRK